ncbi:3-oxoacyl-[acyl-carrier-protein] reductase FabG [Lachnospiraceae bacterium]|nr:3-oxoacyl-[acyl-carrier-protein] reductase FabG [Lachnospiraceae bacterium]
MLKGKTAVITGCLQGIGNETMKVFAKNGCNVFACAFKQTEEFETEIHELEEKYQVKIVPVYFDMSDNASIKAAAREIQKAKIPIDILVNIAGIARDAMFQMVTMEQMQETFQVNFFSQILLSQYIVKLMLRNGKGSVVFTSSITGMDGNSGQLAYGASKAAVISAVKTMSEELGPKGIRVNAIAPGVIKTPMTEILDESVIERKLGKSKLHRIGTTEEVADVIMFLASDLSDYITGQVVRIDGGIY